MYCEICRHAQLEYFISYDLIYDNIYPHRGSKSSIAASGNDFFYDILINIIEEKKLDLFSLLNHKYNLDMINLALKDLQSRIVTRALIKMILKESMNLLHS
ncbi:hypothetical protein LCGC14_2527420 [marine sediment metagenome]|uniref:Uncharacterized protein n=1 Tax=marine sediment metagenome TaxID=412755 RepID=A0A0F9DMX2_9ZZZZ